MYSKCDLCKRKFISKKMLKTHLEYHIYCDKVFYFEHMRSKHVKVSHTKSAVMKIKCTFCHVIMKSMKEKWDHE